MWAAATEPVNGERPGQIRHPGKIYRSDPLFISLESIRFEELEMAFTHVYCKTIPREKGDSRRG